MDAEFQEKILSMLQKLEKSLKEEIKNNQEKTEGRIREMIRDGTEKFQNSFLGDIKIFRESQKKMIEEMTESRVERKLELVNPASPDNETMESAESKEMPKCDSENQAGSTASNKQVKKQNSKCWSCDKVGHLRSCCPEPKSNRKMKLCWKCVAVGHMRGSCPRLAKDQGEEDCLGERKSGSIVPEDAVSLSRKSCPESCGDCSRAEENPEFTSPTVYESEVSTSRVPDPSSHEQFTKSRKVDSNSKPHRCTAVQETPRQLLFGRDLHRPCGVLYSGPKDAPSSPQEYGQDLQARYEDVHDSARERIDITADEMKTRYDAKAIGVEWNGGDKVRLENSTRIKGLFLKDKLYEVLKRLNHVAVQMRWTFKSKPKLKYYFWLSPYCGCVT